MKPRIKKVNGLWYCRVPVIVLDMALPRGSLGIGWTPAHAYQEWQKAGGK